MGELMRMPVQRDDASAEFFDAAREGRFLLRRTVRGEYLAPGARLDPTDPTSPLEWTEASGRGRLVSWIVGRGKPGESGAQPVTALGGLIALEEGPWIMAPIACADIDALAADLPVTATFPEPLDGETLPVFAVH